MIGKITSFVLASVLSATCAGAADLYNKSSFTSLASDRSAARIGDSLTVIVAQSSLASNTTQNGSQANARIGGRVAAGEHPGGDSARLEVDRSFDGAGQTARSDRIAAQISVVVDELLPNGDLHVSGTQSLKINGERTKIRVSGRVRAADISPENTVLSSRLAEAAIDYDGAGLVSRGARAGLVTRLFDWLGLP